MKKRLEILVFFGLFFILMNESNATEIKTIDSVILGNFNAEDIDRSNARIDAPISNEKIVWIRSGIIGNKLYREHWNIKNISIQLNSLGGFHLFKETNISDQEKVFHSTYSRAGYEIRGSKKLARNLFLILATAASGENCAYAVGFFGEAELNFIGNSNLRVFVCDSEKGLSPKLSERKALFLLGSIKVSGNRAMRGYKFPTQQMANYPLPNSDKRKSENHYDGGYYGEIDCTNRPFRDETRISKGGEIALNEWEQWSKNWSNSCSETENEKYSNESDKNNIPAAFTLGGAGPYLGKLEYSTASSKEGSLAFNGDGNFKACAGKWQRKGTNYGTWYLSCDKGLSASGSFEMTGPAKGFGEGADSEGRQVKLTIGY